MLSLTFYIRPIYIYITLRYTSGYIGTTYIMCIDRVTRDLPPRARVLQYNIYYNILITQYVSGWRFLNIRKHLTNNVVL